MKYTNMYHGSCYYKEVTVFKRGKIGNLGPGIYVTTNKNEAIKYAEKEGNYSARLYEVEVRTDQPYVVKTNNPAAEILGKRKCALREEKNSFPVMWITSADIRALQKKGYDSIVWEFGGTTEISVFYPQNIRIISVTELH